ncbi:MULTISPECIES: 16S rRNA (uracil(1498)-N(3))-methyltransferase [unclassified Psychrobacter]|uniref:16S rRNA (uracil(1498)-N(3))-methyltransferase n=1 Tax=unclassified Psychrobacter TaxID=196806 RepID=UPI0019194D31|nr:MULTISPECIES: 16S rRNA (uracil(1498)-N(3))-methyltransferase [unclassified Psychrobacter]|tara:strand:- start:1407 stop:2150 length:744 start_codon:yes stop_codon:yes gene_type:complete
MNCILLPAASFSNKSAHINAVAQIEHVNQVLGAKVGDTLKIGQLEGNLGSAIIADMTPERILLSDVNLATVSPPKLNLTVVLALPRPKVLRRLIMDMTALGVHDIILINSYRTQKSYWQSPLLSRLDEFVLEGLQQGVDTVAPRISLQKRFKPFVEDELANLITNRAIVAHPYAELSFSQYVQEQLESSESPQKSILPSMVFIGAEGGWIDYEVELLARQGCQAVHIGARILRTEAAVNAILGQWLL